MNILLDTNVVARLLGTAGRRIAPGALDILSQPRHRLWVSSVSAYELINKVRLGKWPQAEMIALNGRIGSPTLMPSRLLSICKT